MVSMLLPVGVLAEEVADKEIIQSLEDHAEVPVIVLLKDDPLPRGVRQLSEEQHKAMITKVRAEVLSDLYVENETKTRKNKKFDLELTHQFSTINGFTGNITEEGLEKLLDSDQVEKILPVKPIKLLLDGSVPQINANKAWNLSAVGYNITGVSETICVIDTGVNYSHPALGGCTNDTFADGTCSKVIGGYDYGNSDTDPMDRNSHGTHIAGIAASNDSTYRGVAPGAKIVALKVFTDAGAGTTANVISAIDWCINNRSKFNISIITMSLGVTDGNGDEIIYTSACDSDDTSGTAAQASEAAAYGIFVDASSGNSGNTSGIVSPSCGVNVTSVGSVTKADAISGYNSGPNLDLLAPGSSITSTILSSNFGSKSGTSMAAPHIAGAAALLLQYGRLVYNLNLTPTQVETKLKITGVQINDTRNGIIFPRVDLFAAIQPFLNYTPTSIANASIITVSTALINISSDANITDGILEWSYSNGTVRNISMTSQNTTHFFLTMTNLATGTDTYKIYGNDTINTQSTSSARTLTIDLSSPLITISNPANGSNFSSGTQQFNATVLEINIDQVRFSFNNASGVAFNVTPTNRSGNWNYSLDLSRLQEGVHTLTVFANDTAGRVNNSEFIEFRVDRTPPSVTINTPLPNRNFTLASGNQTFNVMVRDTTLTVQAVLLSFDNASGANFNITAVNQSGDWIASYNVSTLADGSHTVTLLVNDTIANINNSETIAFIVDNTPPTVSFNSPSAAQEFNFQSNNQTFNVTLRDTLLPVQSVLFSFDNASGTNFNITAVNQSGYWVASYNISWLADGSHIVTVIANDTLGNRNNTETRSFTAAISTPIVTLNSPVANKNFSSASIIFNCSAQDNYQLANATLYGNWSSGWHANQTTALNGTSNETTFSKTILDGTYRWNCFASNANSNMAYASANFTFTVDTHPPIMSSVSSGTPTSTAATITWTTLETANATVKYGTTLSLGSNSSSASVKTSQSITLSSLSASTLYYFNVTSCDGVNNCNTNGTYNFTTAAASSGSSDSSSSSAGGGSGGGGGGGSSGVSSAEASSTPVESESASASAESGSSALTGESGAAGTPAASLSTSYTQLVSLFRGKSSTITVGDSKIAFTTVKVDANIEKEISFTVLSYQEKPAELPALKNTYQYLQITAEVDPKDIEGLLIEFKVPKSWLSENHYLTESVTLHGYKNSLWQPLETTLIQEENDSVLYQAKVDYLSYFAITGSSELEKSWFGKLIPPQLGTKEFIIFGIVILTVVLFLLYFFLRRSDDDMEE